MIEFNHNKCGLVGKNMLFHRQDWGFMDHKCGRLVTQNWDWNYDQQDRRALEFVMYGTSHLDFDIPFMYQMPAGDYLQGLKFCGKSQSVKPGPRKDRPSEG